MVPASCLGLVAFELFPHGCKGSAVWGRRERRSELPRAAGLPESRTPPPPPPPRPGSSAAGGGWRRRGGPMPPGARPRFSPGTEEGCQGRPQSPRRRPRAEGISMAAAAPGLRPDPSFLRAATGACPSYGSPARSQEARACPRWRMMAASHPTRTAGPKA